MALFKLKRSDGRDIPLNWVVNSWTPSGGEQSIIQYSAPGTNSGNTIVTGRTAYSITLAGTFIGTMEEISDMRNLLLTIKDAGEIVSLESPPLNNNDTGKYLISSLNNGIGAGLAYSSTFTLTLTEHRESNVKQASVNLISFAPINLFKDRYIATLGG